MSEIEAHSVENESKIMADERKFFCVQLESH